MDEVETSDMEMNTGQGTIITDTGDVTEHRGTSTQKITVVKVSDDT